MNKTGMFNKNGKFKKGHKVPNKWRKAVSNTQKGKIVSREFREMRRKYMLNYIKEHKDYIPTIQKKSVEARRGTHHSKESRKKMSEVRLKLFKEGKIKPSVQDPEKFRGYNNPFFGKHHTKATRKIMSSKASLRVGGKNAFFGRKHTPETIRKILTHPNRHNSPNKAEKKLLRLLKENNFNYDFVGDGKIIIGNKNPDFIHKIKKKLIELWGFYHTDRFCLKHNKDETYYIPSKLIDFYKIRGFDCLVIRYEELSLPEEVLLSKIKVFDEKEELEYAK